MGQVPPASLWLMEQSVKNYLFQGHLAQECQEKDSNQDLDFKVYEHSHYTILPAQSMGFTLSFQMRSCSRICWGKESREALDCHSGSPWITVCHVQLHRSWAVQLYSTDQPKWCCSNGEERLMFPPHPRGRGEWRCAHMMKQLHSNARNTHNTCQNVDLNLKILILYDKKKSQTPKSLS